MQINTSNLLDSKIKKARALTSTTRVYNGRLTSPLSPTSFKSEKVNRLGISLAKNGNLKIQTGAVPVGAENNKLAEDILNMIGCSPVTDPSIDIPNYSLLTKQTDTEIILNPNKIDMKAFKNIGKGKIFFKNVLKDESNPFYRLDQEIPKNYINEQKEIKQNIKTKNQFDTVVSDLYDINFLNSKVPALRSLKRSK